MNVLESLLCHCRAMVIGGVGQMHGHGCYHDDMEDLTGKRHRQVVVPFRYHR